MVIKLYFAFSLIIVTLFHGVSFNPEAAFLEQSKFYTWVIHEQYRDDLAYTLFAEDRSSLKGMKYVLSVIMNRSKDRSIFSLHRTILKKHQFSCWINGQRVEQTMNSQDMKMYEKAKTLVRMALDGQFKPTTKAKFYYNPKKANPSWAQHPDFKKVAKVGDHIYLVRN